MAKGKPRRQPEQRDWQGRAEKTPAPEAEFSRSRRKPRSLRWLAIPVLVALVVTLVCVLFVWLFRRHPPTPLLTLAVTEYRSPIPPNSYAWEDQQNLSTTGERTSRFGRAEIEFSKLALPVTDSEAVLKHFQQRMSAVSPGGPADDGAAMLYLSAQGVVNAQGRACLLLDKNARSTVQVGWQVQRNPDAEFLLVPILDIVARCRTALDSRAQLVVFLDVQKTSSLWPLGLLDIRIQEALAEELKVTKPSNAVLIGSAQDDQVAWTFPELRTSAFAEAVRLGLLGEADRTKPGNGDGKVDLQELVHYVRETVQRLAETRRGAVQTPFVLPPVDEESDFPVAYVSKVQAAPAQLKDEPLPYDDQQLWSAHDRFAPWTGTTTGVPPQSWLRFVALQQGLLRLESLGVAGSAYDGMADDLRKDLQRLISELDETMASREAYNLHELRPGDGGPSGDELATQVESLWSAAPDKEIELKRSYKSHPYSQQALGAWQYLVNKGLDRNDVMRSSLDLLANQPDRPEFPECRALRQWRENGWLPQLGGSAQKQLVWRAIVARDKAEAAANMEDPRAFVFVQPILQVTDRLRRQADDGLFYQGTAESDYDRVDQYYDGARQLRQQLNQAFAALDRAFLELPYFASQFRRCQNRNRLIAVANVVRDVKQLESALESRFTDLRKRRRGFPAVAGKLPGTILHGLGRCEPSH